MQLVFRVCFSERTVVKGPVIEHSKFALLPDHIGNQKYFVVLNFYAGRYRLSVGMMVLASNEKKKSLR